MGDSYPYTAPDYLVTSFNCPFCGAFASMQWYSIYDPQFHAIPDTKIALCGHCGRRSIWYEKEMIFPDSLTVIAANPDLPDEVKKDYMEAASIVDKSPRGAAALLRLAIQKLCNSLVTGEGNLNNKIGKLVERGMHKKVQQALDIVRVIGNEAVHPGEIDLNDNRETAYLLFDLVNIIARQMITEPNEVESIYASLPQAKREQINKRDSLRKEV